MSRILLCVLALSGLPFFLGACDDGDETDITRSQANEAIVPIECAPAGAATTVTITVGGFSPRAVTLSSSAVLRWVNTDGVVHSVRSGTAGAVGAPVSSDGTNIGDGTGIGSDDDTSIIGGIGGSPGLIAPIITPGALFDSGPLSNGQAFCLDFSNLNVAGTDGAAATLAYHCEIHPAETGTLSVVDDVGAGQ